jgi:hypothetical protein
MPISIEMQEKDHTPHHTNEIQTSKYPIPMLVSYLRLYQVYMQSTARILQNCPVQSVGSLS